MKTLQFSIDIRASRQTAWDTMLAHDSYRAWTAEFAEGSYYEGALEPGARIRFLVPSGDGMVAEVAACRAPSGRLGSTTSRVLRPRLAGIADAAGAANRTGGPDGA